MKNKIIFIVCIIAGVTCFSSCKDISNELLGTWNVQTFDNQSQGTITATFDADNNFTRVMKLSNGTIKVDSCSYMVNKKKILLRSKNGSALDGMYRVDKLKGNILWMTRYEFEGGETAGAYLRLEMIKNY